MIQRLIGLILTGTITFGAGNGVAFIADLTDEQRENLIDARGTAIEVLTEAEKSFITDLDGKEMRDLSEEERNQVFEIQNKLAEATHEAITDEELKAKLEERHNERQSSRGIRRGQGNRMDMVKREKPETVSNKF